MRQSWPLVAEPQGPSQRSLGGRATGCSGVHDGKLPTHIYLIVSVLSCILRGLVQVGVTAMNFEIHVAKTIMPCATKPAALSGRGSPQVCNASAAGEAQL